jgi:hypothetical protein
LCYQVKPIDDKAKVKDTLAIGIPTLSTTKLTNTFLNQIICATQITDANGDEDSRSGRVRSHFQIIFDTLICLCRIQL